MRSRFGKSVLPVLALSMAGLGYYHVQQKSASLPDVMEPLIQEKLEAVLKAAAEIPMEWIGLTVHHGWTFDPEDFVRRVREA